MRTRVLLVLGVLVAASAAAAEPLRVGTSGDYPPFSSAQKESFQGFDIAVARAYAADRGLELEFVRFRWPQLLQRLDEGAFDLAMSGVTVRPERSSLWAAIALSLGLAGSDAAADSALTASYTSPPGLALRQPRFVTEASSRMRYGTCAPGPSS